MNSSFSPYTSFARWLRQRHGGPVQKIPLDAGASCPNRDPQTTTGGCVFCNLRGSGTGLWHQGLSLTEQWAHWQARYAKRRAATKYLAYLQSFSNTFISHSQLVDIMRELTSLPDVVAIAIGTRPDCLDAKKLEILAAARHPPKPDAPELDVWLELGLQSANDTTLARINRGHDVQCCLDAVQAAASRGLLLCLHSMFGLPGEGLSEFLQTIHTINRLPVQAVKFHNTLVVRDSALASLWQSGAYSPPSFDATVAALAAGLAHLRPDIVVQRLTADAWHDELLAPDWARDKAALRQGVVDHMAKQGWQQGSLFEA